MSPPPPEIERSSSSVEMPKSPERRLAELGDEQVLRLDVAVQQTAVVGRLQGAGDLHADVEHGGDGERALALLPVAHRPAAVQLHHDARLLGGRERGVEHGDDVGVLGHQSHRPALALEAAPLALVGQPEAEHLERDAAVEVALAGAEDVAEAAPADRLESSKPSMRTDGTEGSAVRATMSEELAPG